MSDNYKPTRKKKSLPYQQNQTAPIKGYYDAANPTNQSEAKSVDEKTEEPTNVTSTDPDLFRVGEDVYGNIRGFCNLCKDNEDEKKRCYTYIQIGNDDLRCENCGCGASCHQLFSFDALDNTYIEDATKDIIPIFNESIALQGINFNAFVVLYQITNSKLSTKNLTWFYDILREAGFVILRADVKQIKKNASSVSNTKRGGTSSREIEPSAPNYGKPIQLRDVTFKTIGNIMTKIRETVNKTNKSGLLYTGKGRQNLRNNKAIYKEANLQNKQELGASENDEDIISNSESISISEKEELYIEFMNQNLKNPNQIKTEGKERNFYEDFKKPVLMMCLSIEDENPIKKFDEINYIMTNNMIRVRNNLRLIYRSKNKLKALWDSQTLFPELFSVNKTFQLLVCKVDQEKDFEKNISIYKDALYSNAHYILNSTTYKTVKDLRDFAVKKLEILQEEQKYDEKLEGSYNDKIEKFIEYYLGVKQYHNMPCTLLEISTAGFDKELSHMSSVLSFNDNFSITQYTSEEDCENFSNFFFTNSQMSSFDRILIMFRPFVMRNSLNQILLNIFRMNNFIVLAEETKKLSNDEIKIFYQREFPTESKLNYKDYHLMMSDGCCQFVLLTRTNAHDNAKTLIGLHENEVNVNFYRVLENYFSEAGYKLEYEMNGSNENNTEYSKLFTSQVKKSDVSNHCFQDMSSLVNVNIFLKELAKQLKKRYSNEVFDQINKIKKNLVKFGSFINMFIYCNKNKTLCEGEVNEHFPKYGNMQEIFVLAKDYRLIKESLYVLRYQILDHSKTRLDAELFHKMFNWYYQEGYLTDKEYHKAYNYLTTNDVYIIRMIKPGGFKEMRKIIGKTNYNFLKYVHEEAKESYVKESQYNADNFLNEKQNQAFEKLKRQVYLLDESQFIEHFYKSQWENIYKIEGYELKLNQITDFQKLFLILQSCLKVTFGENSRYDPKLNETQIGLIERYMRFYNYEGMVDVEEYFINAIRDNLFPKFVKENTNIYFEFMNNSTDVSFLPYYTYIIESENLAFFEIRIPALQCDVNFGSSPNNYKLNVDLSDYLINKNYLYSDDDFYSQFEEKFKVGSLIDKLPFDTNTLYSFMKIPTLNKVIDDYDRMMDYEAKRQLNNMGHEENFTKIESKFERAIKRLSKHFGKKYGIFKDEFKSLQNILLKRIIYLTKYESTKLFIQKCTTEFPNEYIVPQSYQYRIKPDNIFLPINRIFEVEEFGGLNFIEVAILDYLKSRPTERNEKIVGEEIYYYSGAFSSGYSATHKQFSLPAFLWGKKLGRMCKIIEDLGGSPVQNYGPVIFNPSYNTVTGIVNNTFIKAYDTYEYVNIMQDIKESKINIFKPEELKAIEKKLYKILNSEIFAKTRIQQNVRLVPNRIFDNNLRANKTQSTKLNSNLNFVDPTYEKKFHTNFKREEQRLEELDRTLANPTSKDGISISDNEILEKELKTSLEANNLNTEDYKNLLSMKAYLVDLFYHNGMKYHMYAAISYLLKVYYRKIKRKSYLIRLPLTEDEIEKEYDLFLDSMIQGFESKTGMDYADANDKNGNNAYLSEYFLYCLKEVKYALNEIEFNMKILNELSQFDNLPKEDSKYNQIKLFQNNLKKANEQLLKEAMITGDEVIKSEPKPPENKKSDIYTVPRNKYYIPIELGEKYEKDIHNTKYIMTEKVSYPMIINYQKLKTQDEKRAFIKYGFDPRNDYYLIHKTML
ncbi:MAG: hypothetical protein MJ252_04425, partial [archaeon]|nr:hypothetical protein [archaeon]